MAIAVGLRQRLYWSETNTDFTLGTASVNNTNDNRNARALFLIGSARLESLGMIVNGYLDNQRLGAGAKYLFTENIGIMADTYFNYYDNPLLKTDTSVGVQFYHDSGSLTTLKYKSEAAVLLISFAYGF